jgi:hypothetical protein
MEGVSSGIPVVYSTEVPGDIKLLPLPEEEFQKGDVNELGVFDDFRVRILPVLGWYKHGRDILMRRSFSNAKVQYPRYLASTLQHISFASWPGSRSVIHYR